MEKVKLVILSIQVREEAWNAAQIYPPFRSHHEGYAIIKEELEELWEEIKKRKIENGQWQQNKNAIKKEAVQVAAMALRFLYDLCEE